MLSASESIAVGDVSSPAAAGTSGFGLDAFSFFPFFPFFPFFLAFAFAAEPDPSESADSCSTLGTTSGIINGSNEGGVCGNGT